MNIRSILISPDSFKGSLSASAAAEAMERGVRQVLGGSVRVTRHPVSDGGAGLIDVLGSALEGEVRRMEVSGPLPAQRVNAAWFLSADQSTAVIEMAQAAGLLLIPPERRDPKATTTRGLGELLRGALDAGAATLIVGLGGSATNDGGAGMLEALGARLVDAGGAPLRPGGAALAGLSRIYTEQLDPRMHAVSVIAACDVYNPLVGPDGATAVYGPQKGAGPADVALLDAALKRFGDLVRATTGIEVNTLPGAGAAGGTAAALHAFCGAAIRRGIDVVLDMTRFDEHLAGADLVITGEGRIDAQTRFGKSVAGIVDRSRKRGVPVAAVVGNAEGPREMLLGQGDLLDIVTLVEAAGSPEEAIDRAETLVQKQTAHLLRRLVG